MRLGKHVLEVGQVTQNPGKHVIEIVRYSACQKAKGL
jgi:hypothetical protein